jgi:lysozyme family protein
MTDLAALTRANADRWTKAKLTRGPEFGPVARRLVAAKARYQAVEARTGVPWPFIAVTHQRESSQDWNTQLGQGDPLNRVSTHVPKGRGPFATWEDGAYDALVNCSPYGARKKDWSIGGTLTMLEQYNGLGYASRGRPSPYVWSGTDQYVSGKYVADGVYDPDTVDRQLGCAGLLMAMMQLDPSIKFDGARTTNPPMPEATQVKDGAWLQTSLNTLGAQPRLEVDGIVGPATRNAVRAFQLAQNITVDGLVGPETFDALDKALAAGKPVPTIPVPPDITIGEKIENLAGSFWSHVFDLFRPKGK